MLEHFREAEDRIERGAQLMAHIGEKLGFGQIGSLRCGLCLVQAAFGKNFLGNVTRRPAVTQKLSRRVKDRLATHRYDMFAHVPPVDEVAEGVVAVQQSIVVLPLGRLA